jgi:chromosome segregation ATPase
MVYFLVISVAVVGLAFWVEFPQKLWRQWRGNSPQSRLDSLTLTLRMARERLHSLASEIAAAKRGIAGSEGDLRTLNLMRIRILENMRTMGRDDEALRQQITRIVEEETELAGRKEKLAQLTADYNENEQIINDLQKQAKTIEVEAKENQRRLDLSQFRTQAANAIEELKSDNEKLLNASIEAAGQAKVREFNPDRPYEQAVVDAEVEQRLKSLKQR